MSRRAIWLVFGLLTVAIAAAAWLVAESTGAVGPSSLSRGSEGWIAARRYVETGGHVVTLLDRRVGAEDRDAVVVTVFPWQLFVVNSSAVEMISHVRRGGTLVVGHTGNPDDLLQGEMFDRLGLEWDEIRGDPPLAPLAWKRFVQEEWTLEVEHPERPGRITAPMAIPVAPEESEHLAVFGSGPARNRPAAFRYSLGRGSIVVLPAETFSNARLDEPGNADLLERLLQDPGNEWAFDEYNHGLVDREEIASADSPAAVDLFLAHLAILYLLAVYFFGRRFGPPWTDQPVTIGSTSSFLLGLGSLHDRLGHHRDAARLLVSRVRTLEPRVRLPESFDVRAEAADRDELVRMAGEVAELRDTRESGQP